ncbi:MAG: iron ABC transporter permease [Oscillospiraceae bacterium]|nr:iron ABC transporter permease [Oscillospiraceae bacterium]MBR2889986.1 iron ABC transporter permease [Oscillospiraceae bacterium]
MPSQKSYRLIMLFLTVALAATSVIALCVGRYSINPAEAFGAVGSYLGKLLNATGEKPTAMENVVFVLRIPRILGAIVIGAALSLSGAVYQSVFKNPLVSPDILGVSSGASVGAATAILLGGSLLSMQILAFVVGLAAVLLSTAIPKLLKNNSNLMLVLSGTIVGGFMCSVLGVLKFIAEEDTELSSIIYWQMGSVQSVKMDTLLYVAPIFLAGAVILILLSWQLNILSFGENEAKTLGVNLKMLRGITIVISSMLTASAVSISGTIGWIGLIIPHLGRLTVGSDNTKMIPCAMLMGGLFLLVMDTIARTVTSLEVPLSILTGLIGAPIYAWLLWKQKARVM